MPNHPNADVAVIGASFAGLSAAIMLARARRRVVLVDDGLSRNRFSAHSHGFLGQDGVAPAEIRAKGLAEVLAYPTASFLPGRVTAITGRSGGFVIEGPETFQAARVILAYGQRDILPDIPGLADCWGVTANQCPYCHGYELADRTTGLLVTGAASGLLDRRPGLSGERGRGGRSGGAGPPRSAARGGAGGAGAA